MAATIQDAAALFRRLESKWPQRARRVLVGQQEKVLDLARTYSSGPPLSPAGRREAPFATRHGAAGMDPSIVHLGAGATQGDFAGGWEPGPVRVDSAGASMAVRNNTREAGFLGPGTRRMVARPLPARVEREMGPQIAAALADELEGMIRA